MIGPVASKPPTPLPLNRRQSGLPGAGVSRRSCSPRFGSDLVIMGAVMGAIFGSPGFCIVGYGISQLPWVKAGTKAVKNRWNSRKQWQHVKSTLGPLENRIEVGEARLLDLPERQQVDGTTATRLRFSLGKEILTYTRVQGPLTKAKPRENWQQLLYTPADTAQQWCVEVREKRYPNYAHRNNQPALERQLLIRKPPVKGSGEMTLVDARVPAAIQSLLKTLDHYAEVSLREKEGASQQHSAFDRLQQVGDLSSAFDALRPKDKPAAQ